jgi:hypothetical protein
MKQFRDLARVLVSLQGGCRLLQGSQGQMIGGAQIILVGSLMDGAIGAPAARTLSTFGITVSALCDPAAPRNGTR